MYFDLPKHQDRIEPKAIKEKIVQIGVADERISEILNNIEDHWGSPPIFTPNTLAYMLSHQWENDKKTVMKDDKVIEDKVSHGQENIRLLVKEFCNTIQKLDEDKSFSVTNDIMNDNIIQPFIQQPNTTSEQQDKAINRLVELLKHHNNNE